MKFLAVDRVGVMITAVVAMCLAGCGEGGVPGATKTYPVKATITLDGKEFGPARLTFLNPDDAKAPTPAGTADEDGNITVTTYKEGDGMPAGTYKVKINPDPMLPAPSHPQVYDTHESSTLSVTVTATGPNEFTLKMDSSAGPAASGTTGGVPGGVNLPAGFDPSMAYKMPTQPTK